MLRRAPSLLALLLACACGPAASSGPGAGAPAPENRAPDDTPVPLPSCETAPPRADRQGSPDQSFVVTDSEKATEAGTTRTFSVNDQLLGSYSEGGTNEISIRAVDDCGLWLDEVETGSEIGGDPDRRDEKTTLVKEVDGAFAIERLGARLKAVRSGDSLEVSVVETIPAYEGE